MDWEREMGIVIIFGAVAIYFLPTFVAMTRRKRKGHRNENAIVIVNLFLGWTFIGWVVALAWATMDNDKQE